MPRENKKLIVFSYSQSGGSFTAKVGFLFEINSNKKVMTINENGYNKIQINGTINQAADGTIISKSIMINVREEDLNKAYSLYSELERKINGGAEILEGKAVGRNILRTPMCPNCDKPMILRTSKKGEKFFGCSAFPACNGTRPYEEGRKVLSEEVLEVIEV